MMSYGANGRFKGNSLRESMMKPTKPRRKTTKVPPLAIISKDLQRPGGHRRAQRQKNKVGPLDREAGGGTSSTAAAAQCLFCLPSAETRAVSAFPASSRKGSQVVERNRSSGGGKAAVYPMNLPRYTPNEVVLNWKAYSQSSPPSSSSYRSRTEVASQASSSPWSQQPPLTQNSTTYAPSTSTPPNTHNTTTTSHDVSSPRSFNGNYIATLLPGPFLDRSIFPSSPSSPTSSGTHSPGVPEEQLVTADQGLSSPVVIGLAVGCVLAFWLVIGPIVCVVMKRSIRTSQTKLFQRQECRTGSGKRGAQGSSRLLEEMEISALEKARLYHHRTSEYPDEPGHAGRFPVVYAPVPQAPPSPPHHVRGDFCPSGYDPGYVSTGNDLAMDRNSSDTSTRTYETLSIDGTTAIGFCVCGRERFCISSSVRTPVISCPVMQNGRWHPLTKNADFDGWYPEEGYGHQPLPVATCHAKVDADDVQLNFPTIGSAGTSRKFPKMGQTCLRNSYASRGRSRAHNGAQDGLADWSTEDCSRPCPEGRARSEDRVDDEVLINRCVRTPVGYRRLARAGSVSPRGAKARKQTGLDPTTGLA